MEEDQFVSPLLKVSYESALQASSTNTSIYTPSTGTSGRFKSRICLTLSLISAMYINKDLILVPYYISPNGTKVDWTNKLEPYQYRTLWDIIRTCALTVFACTWVTIHPNIPSCKTWLSRFCYKVQLWMVDLVMPELLLLWAAKQFIAAQDLKKEGVSYRCFPRLCSP